METIKRFLLSFLMVFFFCPLILAQYGYSFDSAIPVEFPPGQSSFTDMCDTNYFGFYPYAYYSERHGRLIYTDGSAVFYRLQTTREESVTIHNWGSPSLGFTTLFLVEPIDPDAVPGGEYNCDSVYNVALSDVGACYDLEALQAPTSMTTENQGYIHIDRLPAGVYYIIAAGYKGSNGSVNNGFLQTTVTLHLSVPEEPEVPDEHVMVTPSSDHNYIETIVPRIAGFVPSSVLSLKSATHHIAYYDGLGRPVQTIDYKASPDRKDIISLQEYDEQGRAGRQWLPTERCRGVEGRFSDSERLSRDIQNYYEDVGAFSYPVYEDCPLNRMNESYGPGEEWHVAGKSHRQRYRTNTPADRCLYFELEGPSACPKPRLPIPYPAYELDVQETEDEDGHLLFTFIDKEGHVVLQRQVADSDTLDTYRLYDDFGNLCFVLPPSAVDGLVDGTDACSDILDRYAYQYRYDSKHRCFCKKLPGCDWVETIYDNADQPVFTQDGEQRKRNEWSFCFTDMFGRVTLSGIYHGTPNRIACGSSRIYSVFGAPSQRDFYGHGLFYFRDSFDLDSIDVLQRNYYDTYDSLPDAFPELVYDGDPQYGKCYINSTASTGLLTATVVRVPDGDKGHEQYTRFYYDRDRNLIQSRQLRLAGQLIVHKTSFDFSGQPLSSCEEYDGHVGLSKRFYYDHVGRLVRELHVIDSDTTRFLYDYDGVGRNIRLTRVHGSDSLRMDYQYNLRGWLTSVASPFFSQALFYTDGPGAPCYNGNISGMMWKADNDSVIKGYRFYYDGLLRLQDAAYGEGASLSDSPNRFNEQVTEYDKQGNILGLRRYGKTRNGDYGLIDNLSLVYDGNRLQSVTDNATLSSASFGMEFMDGANSSIEYFYNANGNLTKDLNKKIVDIQYNFLNLPCRVEFENGNSISYLYDANGTKLRATHVIGKDTTVTDYCGNVIYENGVPSTLLTQYGYISLSDNKYHYFLQDHQGNTRVVVDEDGKVEEVNDYYPFGGLMASSSGDVQPYKYNGKELDRKGGLDWYDYGARWYDAALGRWHVVDPLAEEYSSETLYGYCGNNPINCIDPFGMDYWSTSDPSEISRFMSALRFGNGSIFESFNFDTWNHATDNEFTGHLTFNDETNTFYSSYGIVEDGVPTRVGVSVKASNVWEGGASIDGGRGRWYRKASGSLNNVYPEFEILTFARGIANLLYKGGQKLPIQIHHFATNKNSKYTRKMEDIAQIYGLKLDEAWNKMALPHLGRHPNAYHEFVLRGMKQASMEAGGNPKKFLKLYNKYVKQKVINNPNLLNKSGWK